MKKWLSLGLASLMFGCTSHSDVNGIDATNATQPLPTMYDSTIKSPQGQPMTLAQLTTALKDADIVLVGEWHGHPGAHLMQARLFSALYQQNPDMALSMEQFTRDKQHVVNQYLAGEIGEKT